MLPKPFLLSNKCFLSTGKRWQDAKKYFLSASKPLADVKICFFTTPKGLVVVYKRLFGLKRAFWGKKRVYFSEQGLGRRE